MKTGDGLNANSDTNQNDSCGCGPELSSSNQGKVGQLKVKFKHKLVMFTGSVIALSWFFEGWRKIQEEPNLEHGLILLGGTFLTIFFVGIQAYWVYLEEKSKGTLTKRIPLFEKIYELSNKKSELLSVGKGEGLKRG